MSSSSDATLPAQPVTSWAPALDLSERGMRRFDTGRVPAAVKVGREAGYRAGLEQGLAESRAAIDAELAGARAEADRLLATIASAAMSLDRLESRAADAFAEIVVGTAMEVAEAILQRELGDATHRAAEAVRRALVNLDRTDGAEIQLHPDDLVLVGEMRMPPAVRVVPNASLRPGDAIAVTDDRTVDARISTALARARRALEGAE